MPITAKLSRQFYEKLGDEVTNELVSWLNAVDDSYRQEFKDLFAANFGQVRAEMGQVRTEMAQLRIEARAELAQVRAALVQIRAETDVKLARVREDLSDRVGRLVWWMFGFFFGQVAVTISAIVAVRQLLR